MIVSRRDGGWGLVEQVEHGRVAGALAQVWGNEQFEPPGPRASVCTAAARHDEGWRAWDARVLFHELERRPLHFLEIEAGKHVRLYRQGVERVSLADGYAGVLVGMHWTGLYRGRWSSPGARGRLDQDEADRHLQDRVVDEEEQRWVQAKRAAWAEQAGEGPRSAFESRLWHNYELLQLWDLLSLYLCVMPEEPGPEPAGNGPQPWGPQLARLSHSAEPVLLPAVRASPYGAVSRITAGVSAPGVVTLDPYPFREPGAEVEVRRTVVPERPYTPEALTRQVRATAASTTTWRLEPGRHLGEA